MGIKSCGFVALFLHTMVGLFVVLSPVDLLVDRRRTNNTESLVIRFDVTEKEAMPLPRGMQERALRRRQVRRPKVASMEQGSDSFAVATNQKNGQPIGLGIGVFGEMEKNQKIGQRVSTLPSGFLSTGSLGLPKYFVPRTDVQNGQNAFQQGWKSQPGGKKIKDRIAFRATVERNGRITFKDRPSWQLEGPLQARFDVTDAIMRSIGQDPYSFQKMKIADDTRMARDRKAKIRHQQNLAKSVYQLDKKLNLIWNGPQTMVQKRAIFIQLWKEANGGGVAKDVAKQVRRKIHRFICRTMPQGSTFAFTGKEIAGAKQIGFLPYPCTE